MAKSTARKNTPVRKKASRSNARKANARKRLTPRKEARGLRTEEMPLALDGPELKELVAGVTAAGGAALGGYREPLSGRPVLLAALPREAVEPTPFQRDLSPTHVKRLAQKIEESGSFLDPIIVVRGVSGGFWTPNGRHRLAATKVLGLRQVTALVSPDEDLAFRILALNTEKAHNLKDRSLEVIRMARALAETRRGVRETDFTAEFEDPELLTLGLVYLDNGRFAGGAYRPFLRKVERFLDQPLGAALRKREGWAARLTEIDVRVTDLIATLKKRGFHSPYLRPYVVARINPVRFHRARKGETKPPMEVPAALTRMLANARKFDVASVNRGELALVAGLGGGEE